jgi:heptosyltransferase-2
VTDRYLEPLRPWQVADDGEGPEIFPSEEARNAAGELAARAGAGEDAGWVGLAPSARHATKMWPWEGFARAGAELSLRRRTGVILFGGETDAALCAQTAARVRELHPGVSLLDASGKLSLPATAALMDRCGVVLTNDSGLMHLAAARRRKIVAIFGSTVRQFGFAPPAGSSIVVEQHGLPCRPCTHIGRPSCPLGHFRCMTEISPERVIAAASAFRTS